MSDDWRDDYPEVQGWYEIDGLGRRLLRYIGNKGWFMCPGPGEGYGRLIDDWDHPDRVTVLWRLLEPTEGRSGPFVCETGDAECSDRGPADALLRGAAWMTAESQSAWRSERHKCIDPQTIGRRWS